MLRLAVAASILVGLSSASALAGQASATFQVGITIGGCARSVQAAVALKTYTWGAALISVNRAGFGEPQRLEKSDTLYWFRAKRKGGSFRVAVSVASGKIIKILPG